MRSTSSNLAPPRVIITHGLSFIAGIYFGVYFYAHTLYPMTAINIVSHSNEQHSQERIKLNCNKNNSPQFSINEIKAIFNKHIKPKMNNEQYLTQYQWISNATWIPPEFEPDYWIGGNTANFKFDITRVIQTASFSEYVKKYDLNKQQNCANTLAFERSVDPERKYFTGALDYPKCVNFTILNQAIGGKRTDFYTLDLKWKKWDIILLPQFLEHFYDPFIVIRNLYNHLKPGGYLYISTPTINIPHLTPIHYYHYEPMGLAMLMKQIGFEIMEIDFWGSETYISTIFKTRWWPAYNSKHYVDKEPIKNDPFWTSQVWGLFRKPFE